MHTPPSPAPDDSRPTPSPVPPEELEAPRERAQLEVDALRAFFGTPPEPGTPDPEPPSAPKR